MYGSDDHNLVGGGRALPVVMLSVLLLLAGGGWLWGVREVRRRVPTTERVMDQTLQ